LILLSIEVTELHKFYKPLKRYDKMLGAYNLIKYHKYIDESKLIKILHIKPEYFGNFKQYFFEESDLFIGCTDNIWYYKPLTTTEQELLEKVINQIKLEGWVRESDLINHFKISPTQYKRLKAVLLGITSEPIEFFNKHWRYHDDKTP
jgi:hypothetical protein